jgi:histidine phosphotransferase ChpT
MTELEFAAYLVSRVCHDLVGPLNAVVNGLEVLEEEHDSAMRADALKVVTSSANQALARLQFMRLAFGAMGSAKAELGLGEIHSLICGLLDGGRVAVQWEPPHFSWPKDWAKLVMNGALIGADCLPRGGLVRIDVSPDPAVRSFTIVATGTGARVSEETDHALHGDFTTTAYDARGIQPILTYKVAKGLNAGLTVTPGADRVVIAAG